MRKNEFLGFVLIGIALILQVFIIGGMYISEKENFEEDKEELATALSEFENKYNNIDIMSDTDELEKDIFDLCLSFIISGTSRFTPRNYNSAVRYLELDCKFTYSDIGASFKTIIEKQESIDSLVIEMNEALDEELELIPYIVTSRNSIYFFAFIFILAGWLIAGKKLYVARRYNKLNEYDKKISEAIKAHKSEKMVEK